MKRAIILFSLTFFCFFSFGQKRGNIFVQAGTFAVYSTFSVGYESPSLSLKNNKHHLMGYVSSGVWNASLFNKNNGLQSKIGLTYLYGAKNNHFEISAGIASHFDKSLDQQQYLHIATLPNLFLGYRYRNSTKRLSFKAGVGLIEIVQLGIGFNL